MRSSRSSIVGSIRGDIRTGTSVGSDLPGDIFIFMYDDCTVEPCVVELLVLGPASCDTFSDDLENVVVVEVVMLAQEITVEAVVMCSVMCTVDKGDEAVEGEETSIVIFCREKEAVVVPGTLLAKRSSTSP